jgi:1-deoxy-D-xylulose-5-phosphate reductoisomerase
MDQRVIGVAVLGSTGSIGTQTLDVIRALGERFRVVALAAGRNTDLLYRQVAEFRPSLVCADTALDPGRLAGAHVVPMEAMAAHPDVDVVLVGTPGAAGLAPTLAALRAGKAVALANKEVLVMAGAVLTRAAAEGGGELRPVDSEHSAIWQCLWGEERGGIARLILTASGGALRDRPLESLDTVTPEEALRHPTWTMGRKVTVDSATLFNKGLETIEARWLFDVPVDRIEVVMHRESIVHSLVEFRDGSVKAQLGLPNMRLPIQCALTYPERLPCPVPRLDLAALGSLQFAPPDFARYPCLALAMEAGRRGGTYPAVLAAADEVAVEEFLAGRIRFTDIPRLIERVLAAHSPGPEDDLDAVLEADTWARRQARAVLARVS